MSCMKRSFAIGILSFLLVFNIPSAVKAGDPRPPLSHFFSMNALSELLTRIALVSLRGTIGFTYQNLSNDPYTNRMVISDAIFRPQSKWSGYGTCEVKVERLSTSSSPLGDFNKLRSRVEVNGVAVPLRCFPQEFMVIGKNVLTIDKIYLNLEYKLNTSSLDLDVLTSIPNFAAISAALKFSYLGVSAEDGEFYSDLTYASLTLEDMGFWNKFKNELAPEMAKPQAIEKMVGELCRILYPDFRTNRAEQRVGRPSPSQLSCVRSAGKEFNKFISKPGKIVLKTSLKNPLRIDKNFDPKDFFYQVSPKISSGPNLKYKMIPTDLLMKAMTNPFSLSNSDKIIIGEALVFGKGAPRAPSKGHALLRPLAEKGHKVAALVLAKSMTSLDPEMAYRYAMVSGKAGSSEALGIMDKLEQVLTTPKVLKIQAEYAAKDRFGKPSRKNFEPIKKLRLRAQSYLRGRGVFRSYEKAYQWALLGEAAGDLSSSSIAEEIETRMSFRGSKVKSVWKKIAEKVQDKVLDSWLVYNYPSKLKEN